ncbi:MAG: 1-acyl-sn-glycerol-3-phosphate acyltransferase [Halioglobus sp.]|nr:1-acyl-sn-glycerol-3-phosphate acyltransferase [Halioglobus sp.]
MDDPFADIRPYRDEEVAGVLARLLDNRELLDTMAGFRLARLARLAPALGRLLVRRRLAREVRGVADVGAMQAIIKRYMDHMIEDTTGGFSVTGLAQLDPARPYLYMSNHRDIAMDPAFINYALHRAGFQTVRIAIGDNLLTKPWVSDLMRLNKSFIVRRALSGPRELLAASRSLANYIRHSLQQEHHPVWIAQREGRAKDGIDRTEPVIIKMLAMSRDKGSEDFAGHIQGLGIVPVAISYELDPCDALKANELYQRASQGAYRKGEQEDVASIGRGIAGDKGRVHVSFGTPLGAGFATPEAVAAEVDRQVISGYCLHPTNIFAYEMLNPGALALPDTFSVEPGDCSREQFEQRIAALPGPQQPYALAIYANAVVSKLAQRPGSPGPC